MKIIFMGSAELSCASLDAMLAAEGMEILFAVSQPDRPKGRRLHMAPCPLKAFAEARGLKVVTPENINEPECITLLQNSGADYFVIVAYGHILRANVLEIPKKACINLHTSLLPKYRGAAPIQWAIANGDDVTGVTTMHVSKGMDEGDIIYQEKVPITESDTGGSIHDRLADVGAELLVKTLIDLDSDTAPRRAQNDDEATYAPKLAKKDGKIDWKEPANVLYNRIRAFNPWPVAWCKTGSAVAKKEDCTMRIYGTEVLDGEAQPGRILSVGAKSLDVGTGRGILRISDVQIQGGRRMDAATFLRGHLVKEDSYFE